MKWSLWCTDKKKFDSICGFLWLYDRRTSETNLICSLDDVRYLSIRDCNTKFNFHLLYSTQPKYLNRTYSIRIDVFEMNTLRYRTILPRIILIFQLECMKSARESVTFYLIGYFISFLPSLSLFIIFILPSDKYRQTLTNSIQIR
ncbi:hypothetical protein I4U23_023030 [Adineta vaga]|nr:hypothetical protein I4U23_023030 [Adineta vaga]